MDKDVFFIFKIGEFKLWLRYFVGQFILLVLRFCIKIVDRFVNFLEVVESGKGGIIRGEVFFKVVLCIYLDFGF